MDDVWKLEGARLAREVEFRCRRPPGAGGENKLTLGPL
jgi:hypothetical protein